MAIRLNGKAGGASIEPLLRRMLEWPLSWAGIADDKAVGDAMLDYFVPFIRELQAAGLARATLRKHANALWAIGGEVVRNLNDQPKLRRRPALQLLLDVTCDGTAPLVRDATEDEQAAIDRTARKLLAFLIRVETSTLTKAAASPLLAARRRKPPVKG